MARHRRKIIDAASAIAILTLVILDTMLWRNIFAALVDDVHSAPHIYSFPMQHSTSTLSLWQGGVTALINAGADATIVDDIQKTLPSGAPTYIDLAIISAPEVSDYEGYQYVLQHYDVGAFLYNGRADSAHSAEWTQLMNAIDARHIPLITIGAGDVIHYAGAAINVVAPDAAHAESPNASDTTIFLLYNKEQ